MAARAGREVGFREMSRRARRACADVVRTRKRAKEESRRGWGVRDGGAGILTVVAQAGVGVLLSDSVVRFALLSVTSNERGAA